MTSPHPIEIIGGGLAGLSLGLALQRGGIRTTIFEAGDYPRHRVCGEFITGLDAKTIARLDLAPLLADAHRHWEVAWFKGDKPLRTERLPAPALGLSRYLLDARLATEFIAAGGDLRLHTRVTSLELAAGRVFATGRRRGRSRWIGLKIHARDIALARDLELHLGDDGYVGLSPVEDGAVNVCGLFRRRTLSSKISGSAGEAANVSEPKDHASLPLAVADSGDHHESLTHNVLVDYLNACGLSSLAKRLRAARVDPDSFCAVAALEFDLGGHIEDGRVRIGDAHAMIPPFTGNGMAMAFQSAAIALDPLVQYAQGELSWDDAGRMISAALRATFRVRLASAAALHSFLLRPHRQRWFAALSRARILPFQPLYAALH